MPTRNGTVHLVVNLTIPVEFEREFRDYCEAHNAKLASTVRRALLEWWKAQQQDTDAR